MAAAYRINPDAEPTDTDPHSWLRLIGHPQGETGPGGIRAMWGVLRPEYRDFRPSLTRFIEAKLTVASLPGTPPWTISAHRHEVLLPPQAGDHLLDPRMLAETAAREQIANATALATYVTLTSSPTKLHRQWEMAREIGRRLVATFDVAVLLVQHVPSKNGGTAQPHVHMIIPGPRAITPYGCFGKAIAELARDKGRELILESLTAIVGENH